MNCDSETLWISKQPEALPDFIIGGAMKSGTTTLHAILNNHPDIAMAHNELGFFDMDSLLQHPDFNFFDKKSSQWTNQSMASQPDLLWNWYISQFAGIKNNARLVGEDSTTYLSSRKAAKRISQQDKPIKMVFVLRHPTDRTVSNYLHLLKSGRAIYNFEDTLKFNPQSIINRSMYLEQLTAYYHYFPHDSIKLVLFEELIGNRVKSIKEVCEFLGVDFNLFKASDLEVHSNKTLIPKYISLQLLRNKWMQGAGDYRYSGFLPNQPENLNKLPLKYRIIDKIHKRINPKSENTRFTPNTSSLEMLNVFFKSELKGIDDLTQQNIYSKWFSN